MIPSPFRRIGRFVLPIVIALVATAPVRAEVPLEQAMAFTFSAALGVLLDHGANPSQATAEGAPLVCLAARRRETRMLSTLLASGTPVDAWDSNGSTPLACAMAEPGAVIPSAEIAELLIRAGADLEAEDGWGATPLVLAAAAADLEKVQVLLAAWLKDQVTARAASLTKAAPASQP